MDMWCEIVGCESRTRSSTSPAHSPTRFPMEHAPRSFKASRMRRRVGSAIAWRVRSREGSGVDVVMDGLGIAGELTAVNIRNQESEIEDDQRHTRLRCLLLQDRIVTISYEPGAHGFR